MRILGIDPGMRVTGYGCVRTKRGSLEPALCEAGVLSFQDRAPIERRLREMHHHLTELIQALEPDELVIEELYAHYRHPRTAIVMGHARGVILLAAAQRDLPVAHLPATEVKKAITGNGHASKEQIQLAVQHQCRLASLPSPPDVADAIAIALTYGRRVAFASL